MRKTFPLFYLSHNHGEVVLRDASIIDTPYTDIAGNVHAYQTLEGTVIGGGATQRLFNAHIFTPEPIGEVLRWPIYTAAHRIYQDKNGAGHFDARSCG